MPHFGLDFSGPGYFLRPNLGWEFTQYALRDSYNDIGESSFRSATCRSSASTAASPSSV